mgnify:CR=1 FL=1
MASDLREMIRPQLEKMFRHRFSLLQIEKEVETRVSRIDAEVECLQRDVNIVADRQVSI